MNFQFMMLVINEMNITSYYGNTNREYLGPRRGRIQAGRREQRICGASQLSEPTTPSTKPGM
jgi:hypothetical protein